jgi:FkbM family methyltransferase
MIPPEEISRIDLPLLLRLIQKIEFPHKLGVCQKLFAKRLAANGICWVKTAAGPIWKLDLTNSTHRWIVYGNYEGPGLFNWIKRNLRPNPTIIDSGANIGQMSLYFGTYFPAGVILAFEPGEYQADWLSECLACNRHLPVKLHRKGLGDATKTMYLQLSGHSCSHGSQNVVTNEPGECPVRVVRLADALAAECIETVDLWKLDVEGFELPALNGAAEWLEQKRIRALWIETRGENGKSIISFMQAVGYRAFDLDRTGYPQSISDYQRDNTLFLPAQ